MATKQTAPKFAEHLSGLIQECGKTQRQVAGEIGVPASLVNRLCTKGTGSEENICRILNHLLPKKRRRKLEMLTDRRAELSKEPAKEVWADFRFAFLNEAEYLSELCPFPVERAYACTHLGIKISEVVDIAVKHGIQNIQDMRCIDPWKFAEFGAAFGEKLGKKAREVVLARTCDQFPPVLMMDFERQVDAASYVKLINCSGRLIFGFPHLIVGDYTFQPEGLIEAHRNTGGVEFLYSMEGTFELIYRGKVCPSTLAPDGSVFIFDANKKHSIKLSHGNRGRLLMIRFYPQKRELQPGKPRRARKQEVNRTIHASQGSI